MRGINCQGRGGPPPNDRKGGPRLRGRQERIFGYTKSNGLAGGNNNSVPEAFPFSSQTNQKKKRGRALAAAWMDDVGTAKKSRCTLTPAQAFQIYMLKPDSNNLYKNPKGESKSRTLAIQFAVSPKTIRDIWNHRTWKLTTLYAEQQVLNPPTQARQVCSC